MHNSVVPALLCAAVLAFACGPHPHSSAQDVATAAAPRPRARSAKLAAPVLQTSLDVRVNAPVTFTLHLTNSGSKLLELTFPSGQTHDFAVLDAAGREVWRWSDGRMFTQLLQNKAIAVGETVTYEEEMPVGDMHGTFTVVATLPSATHPVVERASFTLP